MSDGSVSKPANPVTGIDPGISSYLDLLRVIAASVVVLSHLVPSLFGVYVIPGHDAVIIFFVISGYVVAYAAEQRDRTLDRFIVNRLARLWSVLLPSVLLSAIAAVVVGKNSDVMFAPAVTAPGAFIAAALRNACFLSQNWFTATPMPFNDPVWSMGYEAWYYAIYAAFVFAPVRWRWHAAAIGLLLAGPANVALMPCWILGAWLYKRQARLVLSPAAAYAMFAACILAYALLYAVDLGGHSRDWLSELTANHSYRLRASTRFASDFIIACLFSGTIVAIRAMPAANRGLAASRSLFRTISSRTFSLYLFHMPVFAILYGGLNLGQGGTAAAILCIALVTTVCVLLGTVTEAQLAPWRRVVRAASDAVRSGVEVLSGAPSGAPRRGGWSRR